MWWMMMCLTFVRDVIRLLRNNLPPGEKYIANDVYLDTEEQQIIIITGPNMAGKSGFAPTDGPHHPDGADWVALSLPKVHTLAL